MLAILARSAAAMHRGTKGVLQVIAIGADPTTVRVLAKGRRNCRKFGQPYLLHNPLIRYIHLHVKHVIVFYLGYFQDLSHEMPVRKNNSTIYAKVCFVEHTFSLVPQVVYPIQKLVPITFVKIIRLSPMVCFNVMRY